MSVGLPQVRIVLIAAVAENGVIGRDNALPWRLPSDLKRFRAVTIGKPVVMGRKTYLSVGKPLSGRTNIVVTRDGEFAAPGLIVAHALDAALSVARGDALRRNVNEICIIGGSEIFNQCWPLADRLDITWVQAKPEGDTYLPAIDPKLWREVERSEHAAGPQDEAAFAHAIYQRA